MANVTKYRLGNQPEEYELNDQYLGWVPEFMKSWEMFHYEHCPGGEYPKSVTLVGPAGEKKTLNFHQWLIKDAFPLHFYGEERTKDWWYFLMVSDEANPEVKFVIPAH